MARPFHARYDGECDRCATDFYAGDEIRPDGMGGWLCEDCGLEDDEDD